MVDSPLQRVYLYSQLTSCVVCDQGRGNGETVKTAREYSMVFKELTGREQRGDPLEKFSNNRDISPNQPLFIKAEKEMTLIKREKECELTLESRVIL